MNDQTCKVRNHIFFTFPISYISYLKDIDDDAHVNIFTCIKNIRFLLLDNNLNDLIKVFGDIYHISLPQVDFIKKDLSFINLAKNKKVENFIDFVKVNEKKDYSFIILVKLKKEIKIVIDLAGEQKIGFRLVSFN